MKLVPKLTLALVSAMCAVLAVNAYVRVRREVAYFEADRVRDHEMVGRTLSTALGVVWRSEGRASALQVITAAHKHFTRLDIRWIESADVPGPCSDVWPDKSAFASATDRPQSRRVVLDAETQLHTCVAIDADAERQGAVEIVEHIPEGAQRTWTTVKEATITALWIAGTSALLALLLGVWLVGRPVRALTEKARRIGRGDFTQPLQLASKDEFSVLAQELNAMCARLASTLEQLRHADRLTTVGKLASGVAHELGTPLNVISARASMIASRETDAEETLDSARVIGAAAERMTNIIQKLLEFARKKGARRSRRDVSALVGETVELLRPLARKRDVALVFEAPPEAVELVASVDSAQFAQVVTNLLMNAMQAVGAGGTVRVTIARERVAADSQDEAPQEALCVRVIDRGHGISAEHLPHVFEPFYTTKDVGEGTGLGLSVSYGIMREHGGWIGVESEDGVGSTFSIFLPVGEPR